MAEKEVERIYVVPLRAVKHTPVSGAAPRAIRQVQRFLSRHMKVELKDIWIDESVNHALWARGKYKIPSRIRVRAVKFDDGVVEVSLPEVEFKSFREELKAIKEAKEPILKREGEAEEEEGAEEREETAEEGEGGKVAEEEVV
ncbi:MAG TPA: 50S ribosomal protein L31e, partial [Thermoplasmatales archaeon]|nr:50S ribosomal protein L31e [Thermoplasmatales archaeon]